MTHEAPLREYCSQALRSARQQGADEVEIFAQDTRLVSAEIEKHDLQTASSQKEMMVGIRAVVDHQVGFACTNVLDELDAACSDAVKLAKASPQDEHNVLPEPIPFDPLPNLYDPTAESFSVSNAVGQAIRLIETAETLDHRLVLGGGSFSAVLQTRCILTSQGIDCSERTSLFTYYALATAKDGDKVSNMAFHFDASHSVEGIDVVPVATRACRDALGSLGAGRGESFVGPVILAPDAVKDVLISVLLFQLNAKNALRGASRWGQKLGESIASPSLTVVDDGRLPHGVATESFDREGLPHKELVLIENGVAASMMHDAYTAQAMQVANTASARGSARSLPRIGPTNLSIRSGCVPKAELIADIKQGLLVHRFSGTANPVSGDFSGVAKAAYLIRNGKLDRPVTGTLIAGNVFDALKTISGISVETERMYSMLLPYVRLEGISVTSE